MAGLETANNFCLRSTRIQLLVGVILCALSALNPISASAQEGTSTVNPATPPSAADTQDDQNTLEPVIVTAAKLNTLDVPSTAGSRMNLTPLQTPASVTSISGDTLRQQEITSVADAETLAPGFASSGTVYELVGSMRGFVGANAVAELYDGMQLFNAGGDVYYPFDPWNIDHIEVLSGPASVLYGTGAVGGAVNVVSKKPDATHQSNAAQLSYGTYNTTHVAADSTGPMFSGLSYRADFSTNRSDGWTSFGQSESVAASTALRWDAASNLAVSLSDDFGDERPSTYYGTPLVNNHVVEALRDINYAPADGELDFRENRLRLREDWTPVSNLAVTNDSYVITQRRLYYDSPSTFAYSPSAETVTVTGYRNIYAQLRQVGDHGFLTYKSGPFGLSNESLVGFDVNGSHYYRQDNTNVAGTYVGSATITAYNPNTGVFPPPGGAAASPKYDMALNQVGGFAEDRLELTKSVTLSAGFRDDHYSLNRDNFFPTASTSSGNFSGTGWNVGSVYNPINKLSLYAQYATATNPVTSLASDTSTLTFALSPARQVEVGAKQLFWNDRVQWTFAAYHIVENNLLTTSPSNPNVSEEVGSQSSHGVEVSLSVAPTNSLQISLNGSTLNAKFDDYYSGKTSLAGYRPSLVPERTANILADWSFLPQWDVHGRLRYVGDRFQDNTDLHELPAYDLLDFGVRWKFVPKANLDIAVNNAANKTYAWIGEGTAGTSWILGEPRTLIATLNVAF